MSSNFPIGVRIGNLLSFEYPERNLIGLRPVWGPRLILVERVIDTLRFPIDPRAVELAPLTRRGRWLVVGYDVHREARRMFYLDAMRHRHRRSWLELALYDPLGGPPVVEWRRGPFAPTKRDRLFLADAIRHYNRLTAGRSDVLLNLGVFPWEPRP